MDPSGCHRLEKQCLDLLNSTELENVRLFLCLLKLSEVSNCPGHFCCSDIGQTGEVYLSFI